jgi:Xaa-Pro aminopeptidase
MPEFYHDGLWDYSTWNEIVTSLPDASFVDITDQFVELMLVKGDEEIANVRKAAAAGESLHEFMLATAREGMDFRELRAEIHKFFTLNDIVSDIQVHMGRGPLRAGQHSPTEYGIHHAGGYAQVTLTFTIGEPSEAVRRNEEIARQVLDYGLDNVRAGRTFASVIDPMEKIVADAGRQHGFPHIHSVMPLSIVGPVGQGGPYEPARGADIVLQPGMALSFECGARNSPRDEVRLGGTGVVTEDGFEMFNTLGLELHSV